MEVVKSKVKFTWKINILSMYVEAIHELISNKNFDTAWFVLVLITLRGQAEKRTFEVLFTFEQTIHCLERLDILILVAMYT